LIPFAANLHITLLSVRGGIVNDSGYKSRVFTFSSVSFPHEFFSFDDPSVCPHSLFHGDSFLYPCSVTSPLNCQWCPFQNKPFLQIAGYYKEKVFTDSFLTYLTEKANI